MFEVLQIADVSIALLVLFTGAYALFAQSNKNFSHAETPLNIIAVLTSTIFLYVLFNFIYSLVYVLSNYNINLTNPSYTLTYEAAMRVAIPFLYLVFSGWLLNFIITDIVINKYFRVDRILLFRRMVLYPFQRKILKQFKDKNLPKTRVSDATYFSRKYFYGDITYKNDAFPRNEQNGYSISVLYSKPAEDIFLDDLAALIIECVCTKRNVFLEIVCCTRHPIEILDHAASLFEQIKRTHPVYSEQFAKDDRNLKEILKGEVRLRSKIVFIDAHTSHFGFEEPVYFARSHAAKDYCLDVIHSARSYPGIHSALVKGVKKIRQSRHMQDDSLGLIIFDELHSLSVIDSVEQYKIFLRHVIASEHLMGGMMTVFCEPQNCINSIPEIQRYFDFHFSFHSNDYDIAFSSWLVTDYMEDMARSIVKDYRMNSEYDKILIMPVLNGGKIAADTLERLILLEAPSLKDKLERSSVTVQKFEETSDVTASIKVHAEVNRQALENKYVLVVDDICHTGDSLQDVKSAMPTENVQVRYAVVIQRSQEYSVDFFALRYQDYYDQLPDAWMYGYGMDNGGCEESRMKPCFIFESRF